MLVRQHNNNVVIVATKFMNRNSFKRRKKANHIWCTPSIFAVYNKRMVELIYFSITLQFTKFECAKKLVVCLDQSPTYKYQSGHILITLLENCYLSGRHLALFILKQYLIPSTRGKIIELVSDNTDHWPLENEKQRRRVNCTGKAKFACSKRMEGVHPKCFMDYHERK